MLFEICFLILMVMYTEGCLSGCRCNDFDLKMVKCKEIGLTKFPVDIESDFEFIRLPGNHIQVLPSNLSKITPLLQKLDMPNNKIEKLQDKTFSGLKKLNYLSLINNELTDIGADVFEGNEVTEMVLIKLSSNRISNINPTAFRGLTTAGVSLRLEKNSINVLHKDVFAGVRYMQTIDLSDNQLEQIDPDLFKDQQRTYFIRLNGNKLTSLHVNTFKSTAGLITLELGRNDIEYLPNDIFRNTPVLQEIDLRENQLSRLPVDLFLPKEVNKIRILGNPLVCDCTLKKQTVDSKYIAKFVDLYDVICINDQDRTNVRSYLENLNCQTTTTPTTTIQQTNGTTDDSSSTTTNMTAGENKQKVVTITKTTTTFMTVDKTRREKSSWPIVLGVLLGVLVLIVCVGLLMYLYRRKIRDKIIEGKLTITRKKKKLNSSDSAEDFQYHDAAGWNGTSTAMLKQTEGNV